jgi:SAM-dependent methyltransferase
MESIRKVKRRLRYLATRARRAVEPPRNSVSLELFLVRCSELAAPRVLELGTKRAFTDRSTRHDAWVPNASEFVGSDIEEGPDVDAVADVHRLSETFGEESFDVIISCSSFEHFKYPQLAAHEIMRTLRVGGLLYIQTHQTFPLHAAPHDYFRFSADALRALFGTGMGFRVIEADHQFPAEVRAAQDREIRFLPAYLNSNLFGEKIAPTPSEYLYELSY